MAEATSGNVTDKLRAAVEAQERVKQAARDAAAKANPQGSPGPVTPQGGAK